MSVSKPSDLLPSAWCDRALVVLCLLLTNCNPRETAADSLEGGKPGEARNFPIGHGVGCEFRWVPAGNADNGTSEKIPDGFWIAADPISVSNWQTVMQQPPTGIDKTDGASEARVLRKECDEFLARLESPDGGWIFKLADEVEWEHACRAGLPKANPRLSISKSLSSGNAWGIRDMYGDVEEWCVNSASPNLMKPAARLPLAGSELKFQAPARGSKPRFLHLNRIGFRIVLAKRRPAPPTGPKLGSIQTP